MTTTIKTEFPAIKMRVEGQHLVPLTPHDAERIDTFSQKRDLSIYVVQEPNSAFVRKWWAVLNLVIKQCKTPWTNSVAASDAMKLALGKVKPFKTVGGNWGQTPMSLNDLDDDEQSELFNGMLELMEKLTGVDPSTLKKESADVGPGDKPKEQVQSNSDPKQSETEGDGQENATGNDQAPADDEDVATSDSSANKQNPDSRYTDVVGYGRYLCNMLKNFIDDGSITDEEGCKKQIQAAWNTANHKEAGGIFVKCSDDLVKKGKAITNWADKVVGQEIALPAYKNRVAELLSCSLKDLG